MKKVKKIVGIICEYNPFHNGHIHHIQKVKELLEPDVLICVMSGNFVQRGEAAICDKWLRAEEAMKHGVDMVIELPVLYATQSANYFAKASMQILQLAGAQDVVFGSESNDIKKLEEYAKIDPSKKEDYLENGTSNAKAYASLYEDLSSNDILGVNYIRYKGTLSAHCIKRTNTYNGLDINHSISSATAIRNAIFKHLEYEHTTPMNDLSDDMDMNKFFAYLKTFIQMTSSQQLQTYFMVDEGIENLFKKQIQNASSYDEFVSFCTTKRYTASKIKRTLLHILLQTTKDEINTLPTMKHIRVLAFNDKGKEHLASIKEDVLVVSKFNQLPSPYKEQELRACMLYTSILDKERQKRIQKKEIQSPLYIR